jgi:hypothetical protein
MMALLSCVQDSLFVGQGDSAAYTGAVWLLDPNAIRKKADPSHPAS